MPSVVRNAECEMRNAEWGGVREDAITVDLVLDLGISGCRPFPLQTRAHRDILVNGRGWGSQGVRNHDWPYAEDGIGNSGSHHPPGQPPGGCFHSLLETMLNRPVRRRKAGRPREERVQKKIILEASPVYYPIYYPFCPFLKTLLR